MPACTGVDSVLNFVPFSPVYINREGRAEGDGWNVNEEKEREDNKG